MPIFKVIILAIVQGLAELLPVSSSAHVVVAEKLMGLDPSSPQMTLLLVMLHTGTMFAVIVVLLEPVEEDVLLQRRCVQTICDPRDLGDAADGRDRRGDQEADREDRVQRRSEGRD